MRACRRPHPPGPPGAKTRALVPHSLPRPCAQRLPLGRQGAPAPPPPPASLPVNQQAVISSEDEAKLELMQQRFTLFDVDKTGELSRDQLHQLLQSMESGASIPLSLHAQHWLSDAELDRVMETYDKDSSGTISLEEFSSIVTDGLLLEGALTEYEEAFKTVDRSGNGTIGAMELLELFKALGQQDMNFDKLSNIMEKYDKDESGQIEFNEFLLMFRDQVLDLKDMSHYLSSSASDTSAPAKSREILDLEEGGVSLIFSEQELETVMQRGDKLVLVYTALTWCRPCKAMTKPLERLARHYKDSFIMVKLFGNSNEQTKRLFKDVLKVRSTPCFMIFKGQELLHTQLGPNKEKLEDALRSLVLEGKMPQGRLYFPQT